MAVLMMLSETDEKGNPIYTLDDIYDNTRFVEHKQELFDLIVQKNATNTKEDREFFAKTIYKGLKAVAKLQDQLINDVDVDEEDFDMDEPYIKIASISNIAYDAWQEFTDYIDEAMPLIQADAPDIKDKMIAKEYAKHMAGVMGFGYDYSGWVAKYHLHYDEIKKKNDADASRAEGTYFDAAIKREYIIRSLKAYKEDGKGQGFFEYCHKNSTMDKVYGMFHENIDEMMYDKKLFKKFDKLASEGLFFSGVTFKENNEAIENIENFPYYDEDKGEFVIPNMKKKTAKKANVKAPVKEGNIVIDVAAADNEKAAHWKEIYSSQVNLETKLSCYINICALRYTDKSWSQEQEDAIDAIWDDFKNTYIIGADELTRRRVFEALGRISTENDIRMTNERKAILDTIPADDKLREKKATYLAKVTSDSAVFTMAINDTINRAKQEYIIDENINRAVKREANLTKNTTMAQIAAVMGYKTPEDVEDFLETMEAHAQDKVFDIYTQKDVAKGRPVPSEDLLISNILNDVSNRKINNYRLSGKRESITAGKFNEEQLRSINEMIDANGKELSLSGIKEWTETEEVKNKVKLDGDSSLIRVKKEIEDKVIKPFDEEKRLKAESEVRKRQPIKSAFAQFFEKEENGDAYKLNVFDQKTAENLERDLEADYSDEFTKLQSVQSELMNVAAYGDIYQKSVGATRTPTVNAIFNIWALGTHPEIKDEDIVHLDENPALREEFISFCKNNPAAEADTAESFESSVKNWAEVLKAGTDRAKKIKLPDVDYSDPKAFKKTMLLQFKYRNMIIDFSQQKDSIFGIRCGLSGKKIAEAHIGEEKYQDMLDFWADSQNFMMPIHYGYVQAKLSRTNNTYQGMDSLAKIAINRACAAPLLNAARGKSFGDIMNDLGDKKYYYHLVVEELKQVYVDGEPNKKYSDVASISREDIFNYLKGKNKASFEKKVKKLLDKIEPVCKKQGLLIENQKGVSGFRNCISMGDAYDKLINLSNSAEATLNFLRGNELLRGIENFDNGVLPSQWVDHTANVLFNENYQQKISAMHLKRSDVILVNGKTAKELWGAKYANVENERLREDCYQVELLKAIAKGESNISFKNIAVGKDNRLSVVGKINLTRSAKELQKMKRGWLQYDAGAKRIKDELIKFQKALLNAHIDRKGDAARREIGKVGSDLFKTMEKTLYVAINNLGDNDKSVSEIEDSLNKFKEASDKYYKERKNIFFSKQSDEGQLRLETALDAKNKMPDLIMYYKDIIRDFKCDLMVNNENTFADCSVFFYKNMFTNSLIKRDLKKINKLDTVTMTEEEIKTSLDNKKLISHEKVVLRDIIAKGLTGMNISYSDYLKEFKTKKNPDPSHMSVVYLVNDLVDKMHADGVTVDSLKQLQESVKERFKNGSFKKEAETLGSNTVFREVLKANKKNFCTEWAEIEKQATEDVATMKASIAEVSGPDKDPAKFVMSGEVNGENIVTGQEARNARYSRLGILVARQILTDPKNRMVVQAIKAGRMQFSEVVETTTQKMRNNRVLEGNHFSLAGLREKIDSGRLKNMAVKSITSQAKTNAKTRLPNSFIARPAQDIAPQNGPAIGMH